MQIADTGSCGNEVRLIRGYSRNHIRLLENAYIHLTSLHLQFNGGSQLLQLNQHDPLLPHYDRVVHRFSRHPRFYRKKIVDSAQCFFTFHSFYVKRTLTLDFKKGSTFIPRSLLEIGLRDRKRYSGDWDTKI